MAVSLATVAPKYCRCGHSEDSHYQGGVCTHIDGDERCGCEKFVDENDRTAARAVGSTR